MDRLRLLGQGRLLHRALEAAWHGEQNPHLTGTESRTLRLLSSGQSGITLFQCADAGAEPAGSTISSPFSFR